MGMSLDIYVGPYMKVNRSSGFDWTKWEDCICNGRGEFGVGESDWILIPNQKLEGVERQMLFDRMDSGVVWSIGPSDILREIDAFSSLASGAIRWCYENGAEWSRAWGIVPSWS